MSGTSGVQVRKPKTKKSEALWMTTMSDLSFILMSFFALMLSMSSMSAKKFEDVVENIKTNEQVNKASSLQAVEESVTKSIKQQKLTGTVSVKQDSEGMAVEFKDGLMFSPASADLSEQQASTIKSILDSLIKANPKYMITIEGHTDDTPLGSNARFRSNWELASARGVAILEQLVKQGVDRNRIRVVSYADTRPKVSITQKSGSELSQARSANRRVVIRLD